MSVKISYILPCYNVERYITACLDSIYNQGIAEDEFEVICVNDCSPDSTRDKIIFYKQNHCNLKLIDHKKNKRVGAARNTGFYEAQGEYVWYIDPDDRLKRNATKELLPLLDDNNLDFVQFGHKWRDENDSPILNPSYNHNCPFDTDVISGVEFLEEYQRRNLSYVNMHVGCFVRIYRRKFLLDNNILFPEVAYYEDQYQALHGLLAAKRMKNLAMDYYYYYYYENSYSHAKIDLLKQSSQIVMICQIYSLCKRYQLRNALIHDIMSRYKKELHYFKTYNIELLPNSERHFFVKQLENNLSLLRILIFPCKRLMCDNPRAFLFITDILHFPIKFMKWVKSRIRCVNYQ